MARAAAIIVEHGRVALIERENERGVYYLFPGGHIEAGESPAEAAAREVREELGLEVVIGRLVVEVMFKGVAQSYFLAQIVGGEFGTGDGPEVVIERVPGKGRYTPIWLPTSDLARRPVFPIRVARLVAQADTRGWPAAPLRYVEG